MAQNNEHHGQQRSGSTDITNTTHTTEHAEKSTIGSITPLMIADPWHELKQFTSARIALGRAGSSLPTKEILNFGLSHAMARDAVHLPLDVEALAASLKEIGLETLQVQSKAADRHTYLLRPDLGRRLNDENRQQLLSHHVAIPIDLVIVIGDGLSSLAIQRHAKPFLEVLFKQLPASWKIAPIIIAKQARVALADEVGECLGARMSVILIGERPGLSSPDSMGIYLTYAPKVGCSDAERNCISNIRQEGLAYDLAAQKLNMLIRESIRLKLSGVNLKDESFLNIIE